MNYICTYLFTKEILNGCFQKIRGTTICREQLTCSNHTSMNSQKAIVCFGLFDSSQSCLRKFVNLGKLEFMKY